MTHNTPDTPSDPIYTILHPLSLDLKELSRSLAGLSAMAQLLRQNDDHKDTDHGPTLEDDIVLRLHAGLEGIAGTLESEVDKLQARIQAVFRP